jgi:hypothetical protein
LTDAPHLRKEMWGIRSYSIVLAPVSFHEDPAASTMYVVACDPDGMRARWCGPVTGRPNVTGTVPAMIAADPDVAGMRAWAIVFNDRRWRRDADDNLRLRGIGQETGS